jgi:predicted amidohydrolase
MVGLCQTHTEPWDVDGNLARVLADIREAADQGAELVITPECVLNGYPDAAGSDPALRERFAESAEPLDGPRLARVRSLAREAGVEVVFGFAERTPEGRFHNTAVLIGRDGATVWAYRKVHCRPFESAEHDGPFTPGAEFFVTERRYAGGGFPIGAMICFDREVPESVRCLRALGAAFIACPLATRTFPLDAPVSRADNEVVTRTRAAENEVFIAVVNHAGRFNGGSYVVGPLGEVLCRLGEGPEVRTVPVCLATVAARFHADPYGWMGWGFRRPDVYRRYLD